MEKRLRVMQLFYSFDVESGGGGLTRFAIELGKKLDPKFFEVILCSLGYYDSPLGKQRMEQLNAEGIRSFEAAHWDEGRPYSSFYNAYQTLRKVLSETPVDVLHSHSEYTDIAALMLKATDWRRVIIRTVHYGFAYEWATKPERRALLTNFLYPILFNKEIGINQFNTDRMNRRWIARLLRQEAITIYNAIPLERFDGLQFDSAAKKISLGIPADAPVIGSVGRLTQQKGYCYLVDAVPLILRELPQAYFMIIGDGHLLEELQAQAERLGVAERVLFTGARTDVDELLHCMNLFVSSSLWEGLPTVVLEAMACHCPVVATDIPGTNELVRDGVNGWLAPASDSQCLAEVIVKALRSPDDAAKYVLTAQDTIQQFSIAAIARQYESLYQSLIRR